MKFFKVLILLALFFILVADERQIKYFLSEQEFLIGSNVPRTETVRKEHIRAEYDQLGRLVLKANINRKGRSINQEQYSYIDSNLIVRQKDIVNNLGQITDKTIFGREPESVSYIMWVFGIDSVKRWGDRFTTSLLNENSKPDNYRFFDVDAFEYGGKEFDYDVDGRVIRDEWFRRPDNKSMHKFLYKYYDDLEITHVFEYDSNGVLIMDVKLSPDGTEAVFWFTGPNDSSYVNNSSISYNLDGDLKWGYLNWVMEGSTDSLKVDLESIKRGDYIITLPEESALRDSYAYNIHFNGEGVKGYMATRRILHFLQYDISPPLMSLEMDKYMKEVSLSYAASEKLDSAFVIWNPDSNFSNISIDTVVLSKDELSIRQRFFPTNQTPLVDGVMYNPEIYGIDRAGNLSTPAKFEGVIYDITPPTLSFTNPDTSAWINNQLMGMSTNEPIQNWSIYVNYQGDVFDEKAPHIYEFTDTVQTAIDLDLSEYFQFNDGTMYQFSIVGSDLAGNISDTTRLDSIHYDITPPVVTMIFPFDNAAINNPTISYALSEQLLLGEVLWTQVDGAQDTLSPHNVEMVGEELSPEEKIRITMLNEPILTDGSIYSIVARGRDLAGNDSEPFVVKNVLYDTTPPEFTEIRPESGDALNHQMVTYSLSEDIEKGMIIWRQTGGNNDPDSPHKVILNEDERKIGLHEDIVLNEMPQLIDGGIYSISFTGSDRAGNIADTVIVKDILYDFTAPVIAIQYPYNELITNTKSISYSASENLFEAKMKWDWVRGVADSLAPYVAILDSLERIAGSYTMSEINQTPEVVENAIYDIYFTARDRAGNEANEVIIKGLEYDFTPPVLTWISPQNGDAVNHKDVQYENSELLKTAIMTWKWIGGVEGPDSIHAMNLFGDELSAGGHGPLTIANAPPLTDGGIYSIAYSAFDPAGNESNQIFIDNILYDITAPVIVVEYPSSRSILNTMNVSYSLSEEVFEGSFKWTWMGGVNDDSAPYTAILTVDERTSGPHNDIELSNNPEIVENALYTISVNAKDRAGNEAKAVFIPGIQYDFTPPTLTILSPVSGEAINQKSISFMNSELLESGQFIWTQTGGNSDNNSPHISNLKNEELLSGEVGPAILREDPMLVDGAIYEIKYVASDPAGNISDTVIVKDILYDITAPLISINYPQSNAFINKSEMLFDVNENMYDFSIIWEGVNQNNEKDLLSFNADGIIDSGQYNSDDLMVPELKDATVYTIKINGKDRAGNIALESSIDGIKVDFTPPVFTELIPKSDAFINQAYLSWSISEDIESGSVFFKSSDSENPLEATLVGTELSEGLRSFGPLENFIALRDGKVYDISIKGTDFAGNISEITISNNITFDTTPATLSILDPISGSFVNSVDLLFSTSEPLTDAKMIWIGSGLEPMTFDLNEKDLTSGEHILTGYGVQPIEKTLYSILITGSDRATNISSSDSIINLTFDITPPEFEITGPLNGTPVNNTQLSFNISEPLSEGLIKWELTSGVDTDSPHEIALTSNELAGGNFQDLAFTNPPGLKDGSTYKITILGTDLAGNKGQEKSITDILFDITPPNFVNILPVSEQFINVADISYTLTENLQEGKIVFTNVGGITDPNKEYSISLAGGKKNQGKQGGKLPVSVVSLNSGSIYSISFFGTDPAGNEAPQTIVENITFDNIKPVVEIEIPTSNTYINSPDISYTLSEKLKEGNMTLTYVAGSQDNNAPHSAALNEDQRNEGTYELINFSDIKWMDGATYDLTFSGMDFANNNSNLVKVSNVTYDITPPIISIDNLNNNIYINNINLSYTLSEPIANATMVFTQTNGSEDSNSPHTVSLEGSELNLGSYSDVVLNNAPNLVNGAIYDLEFNAKDYATNSAKTIYIEQINFDDEPPEVTISRPLNSEQIKSTIISYSLTEDLASGIAIFEQTSGTVDLSSPHRVELAASNLTKGMHSDIDLNITSNLADGGRYTVKIEGLDRAGNNLVVTPVEDVFFDLLPPNLTLDKPTNGSRINQPILTYGSNEELGKGTLSFVRTGGAEDPNSPHAIELTGQRLKQGAHYDESFNDEINLKDGSIYSLVFSGQDLAGNIATDVSVTNIIFDSSPPSMVINSPQSNGFYNILNLDFSVDEDLKSATVLLESKGGLSDPLSPHKIELEGEYLNKGTHKDIYLDQLSTLTSNSIYDISINAVDIAGNEGSSELIIKSTFDNIPPELLITDPVSESSINIPALGLRTNEILSKASIDWSWAEGEDDPVKNHRSELLGAQLQEGVYPDVKFNPPPKLTSNAWYDVTFNGTDRAGNNASFSLGRLYFDNLPAVLTSDYPASNAFINTAELSYTSNEVLGSGSIEWKPKDGSPSISIELSPTELTQNTFKKGLLSNQVDLQDGLVYDLIFNATDLAGNEVSTNIGTNIQYDISKPKFTQVTPITSARINTQLVKWTVDEDLSSGKYTWIHMGGSADPSAPHEYTLTPQILSKGTYDNSTLPDLQLIENAMYRITLEGTDLAGNTGKKFIMSIVYDDVAPKLGIKYPEPNTVVNNLNFAYFLSEQLGKGQFIYTQIGGEQDPNSPVVLSLSESELEKMIDVPRLPTNPPVLNDGSIYNIKFVGEDLATNKTESDVVENVRYDITRPKISISYPSGNTFFLGTEIGMEVSEDLLEAVLIWTRTGGLPDDRSPHRMPLSDVLLKKGTYQDAPFPINESLNTSAIYTLSVEGKDFADNDVEPVSIQSVEYIRDMSGKWYYKGAIIEVVWVFEPDDSGTSGNFMQGLSLGTKISDEEKGTYSIDFSSKPFVLKVAMENPDKNRVSLLEFVNNNKIRVVTGETKPKNMTDGEVMEYEWREE